MSFHFVCFFCLFVFSRRDLLKANISRKLESLYLWVNKISLTAHKSLAIMAAVEDGWTMHSATLRPTMELTQKLLILILASWVKKSNQYNFFLATAGQTVNTITICWQIISSEPLETLSCIKNPKNKLLLKLRNFERHQQSKYFIPVYNFTITYKFMIKSFLSNFV